MATITIEVDETFAPRRGGQESLWADRGSSVIYVEGGWGSGKSYMGARMLMDTHLFNAYDEAGRATGVPSAIVSATQTLLSDTALPHLAKAAAEMGLTTVYRSQVKRSDGVVLKQVVLIPELKANGVDSYIICRTAAKPELITGWEVGCLWGDEVTRWPENRNDPRKDPFTQIQGRVRDPRARFKRTILTYTNEGDATTVYEEARKQRAGSSLYRLRTADNDSVREWMQEQRSRLSEELAAQYFDGDAVRMRGSAVYSSFRDEAPIVSDGAKIDAGGAAPIALSLDFNIAPGMHGLIGQQRGAEDRLDVVDEIHGPGMTVPDLVEAFAVRYKAMPGKKPPMVHVFGDPAGDQRNASTGVSHWQTVHACLAAAGVQFQLRVRPSHGPVIDGVNACNAALRGLDGASHLFIHPRCEILRRDLRKLKYDDDGAFDESDPRLGHMAACLRYWVEYVRPCRIERKETVGGRVSVRVARGAGGGRGHGRP